MLLGFSFPPFQTGIFAYVSLIHFLFTINKDISFLRYIKITYFTFFVFSIIALYWVGGFTHLRDPYLLIAGGSLLLFQPAVFTFGLSLYFFIKRSVKSKYIIFVFPFIWITMEWLYAYGEFSFPWLTIGNSQSYNLLKLQITEITGIYGLSLHILIFNVVLFWFLKHAKHSVKSVSLYVAVLLMFYLLPDYFGLNLMNNFQESKKVIKVGILQPNLDPWDKWEGSDTFLGRWRQVEHFMDTIDSHSKDSLDIVVLPESAILLDLPSIKPYYESLRYRISQSGVNFIAGYVDTKYYNKDNAPKTSSVIRNTGQYYDSYNSIFFVQADNTDLQTYSKMRLVPFAERIPYVESVPFLIEPLRWGVGISNWAKGTDSTVFVSHSLETQFLAMICYESIFPEFVSSFVKKGAEFLIFITNDSWWGNTSGARQHFQYSIIRAIENRRWCVRCANGGISGFIDPLGNTYEKTSMYTADFRSKYIYPQKNMTFYTIHGDYIARISAWITLLITLLSIIYLAYTKVYYGK